jgi:hypothetical protein
MKKITKNDVFKIKPAKRIETLNDVPGYEEITFGVKVMSAGEHEDYENMLYELEQKEDGTIKANPLRKDTRIKLLLFTVCDPNSGELLFSEDDIPQLREMPNDVIKKLFEKAREVNQMVSKEDTRENMEKN